MANLVQFSVIYELYNVVLSNSKVHNFTDGVTADVKGKISSVEKPNGTFLRVDSLFLDLNVKKPKLSVAKIFNNNKILSKFRFDLINDLEFNQNNLLLSWWVYPEITFLQAPRKLFLQVNFFVMEKLFHSMFYSWRHKSLPEGEWTWNSQSHATAIAEKVELRVYRNCKYSVKKCSSKLLYFGLNFLIFYFKNILEGLHIEYF